jgi:hypothetical protein
LQLIRHAHRVSSKASDSVPPLGRGHLRDPHHAQVDVVEPLFWFQAQLLVVEADRADQNVEAARATSQHEPDAAERIEGTVAAEREQNRTTAARESGKHTYDSAERRQAFAADLERRGIHQDTVAARVTADVSQGKSASEAVEATGKAPKLRKQSGTTAAQSGTRPVVEQIEPLCSWGW